MILQVGFQPTLQIGRDLRVLDVIMRFVMATFVHDPLFVRLSHLFKKDATILCWHQCVCSAMNDQQGWSILRAGDQQVPLTWSGIASRLSPASPLANSAI